RSLAGHLLTSARGGSQRVPEFVGFADGLPRAVHGAWMGAQLAARLGLDRNAAMAAGRGTFRGDFYGRAVEAIPGYAPSVRPPDRFFDGRDLDIAPGD
ncbi:MAG: hypothetical protein WBA67_11335, partial [Jannaschia sp.]